jgi:hypothetical protein
MCHEEPKVVPSSGFRWDVLQDEVREWSVRNFGDNPAHRPILGIIEELGELIKAEHHDRNTLEAIDAVGDVMIYMADFCGKTNRKLMYIAGYAHGRVEVAKRGLNSSILDAGIPSSSVSVLMSKLAHHWLKSEQGIRKGENHERGITNTLLEIVELLAYYYPVESATGETWKQVSQRDWKKNAETGQVDVGAGEGQEPDTAGT